MPTINVSPGSDLELQEIADTLGRSRKVIVVTGAGISTNCGIPDFRSENGLYSLIQAQYDAALQNPPWENTDDYDIDDRPKKKRRVTDRWYYEIVPGTGPAVQDKNNSSIKDIEPGSPKSQSASQATTNYSTPATRRSPDSSPLSSPRSITPPFPSDPIIEDALLPPPHSPTAIALSRSASLQSESSRSSSVFTTDEKAPSQSGSSAPSCSASHDVFMNTEAEQEQEFASSPPSTNLEDTAPQSQSTSRALPNLKGRDLFDSMVWADPFTTSIFYMFISSLRNKIQQDVKSTTRTHKFIRTLRDGGRLVRNYTQNIDCLEERESLCTDLTMGAGNKLRFTARNLRERRPDFIDPESRFNGGVECVLLHGSLVALRCGICGKLCSWDTDNRAATTLSGAAPDCPSCADHSARRRGRGRRGLAVGRLRPDIVLYGEEHPNSSLIAPLITHDLSLGPDFLLILGTSLKVHGLKIMVKEFAKSVHARGGKVVFVNRTKPPESTWGEFIDYWVEWDCDEWVANVQERRGELWLPQGSQVDLDGRDSTGDAKDKASNGSRTQAWRPQAVRDDKLNGIYQTFKILDSLRLIEDPSGAVCNRRVYWEKTGRTAPVRSEPIGQPRKSLPASKNTAKGNSIKRKSCPSTLPNSNSSEDAEQYWNRLRELAPGLGPELPESGKVLLKDLLTNFRRTFEKKHSQNNFPWLKGLTLGTHPPSGVKHPHHPPETIEMPLNEQPVQARPINHSYGTRASARFSGISADSPIPVPISQEVKSPTIAVGNIRPRPDLLATRAKLMKEKVSKISVPLSETSSMPPESSTGGTITVDTPGHHSPALQAWNENTTIIVDDTNSRVTLPSSFTSDTIIVAIPSTEASTPPASDPETPSSQRIKRLGSIGAILSSPESGSRSDKSAETVYYDAEDA